MSTDHALLVLLGRGELPFALLHRRPLYLHALDALGDAGGEVPVVAVEASDHERVESEVRRAGLAAHVLAGRDWWSHLRAAPAGSLLVHDPLCPLAASDFLRSVRDDAATRPGVSLAAFRPVTDTVKTVVEERIVGTIDRERLAALIAPVLVAAPVLARAVADDDEPPLADLAALVAWLRGHGPVELVKGPSLARRVDDASAVNLLECVDELARRVRTEAGPLSGAAPPGTP